MFGRPSYTVSKQDNDNPNNIYNKQTKIASDLIKKKFAKVYGGEIKVAPKPKNDLETNREKVWRHLVVRGTIDKEKTKQTKFVPQKYRFENGNKS